MNWDMVRQTWPRLVLVSVWFVLVMLGGVNAQKDVSALRIVAFGDSLTAGYGLAEEQAFPAQLQLALRDRGHHVDVVNAGVSGDTMTAGLSRLEWSLADGADLVIVALGANDALRGIDPAVTADALSKIIEKLRRRNIQLLIAGMKAPPNMGQDYVRRFEAVFVGIAEKYGVPFYPFFLEGVAAQPMYNQDDGIHPNAGGVAVMVTNILPAVEQLLAHIRR